MYIDKQKIGNEVNIITFLFWRDSKLFQGNPLFIENLCINSWHDKIYPIKYLFYFSVCINKFLGIVYDNILSYLSLRKEKVVIKDGKQNYQS